MGTKINIVFFKQGLRERFELIKKNEGDIVSIFYTMNEIFDMLQMVCDYIHNDILQKKVNMLYASYQKVDIINIETINFGRFELTINQILNKVNSI